MAAYDFSNVSPADMLKLEYADEEEKRKAENRVNTFKRLMGQQPNWRATSGSAGTSALTAYSKSRDVEHLSHIRKTMSAALGTTALPYNNIEEFNIWYKTQQFPYRFEKDARTAYESMSSEVRAQRDVQKPVTREVKKGNKFITETWNYDTEAWEQTAEAPRWDQPPKHREIKKNGNLVTQNWDYGIKKWVDVSTAPRYEKKAPEIKEFKEGDKIVYKYYDATTSKWVKVPGTADAPRWDKSAAETREFKIGDEIHTYKWDEGEEKWVPMEDMVSPRFAPREKGTTKQKDFEYWLALRKEGGIDDDAADISTLWQDFVQTQQKIELASTPKMKQELADKKEAFLNSTHIISRMLDQLSNPKVVIGGIRSIFAGFENITGQAKQIAAVMGDDNVINADLYEWGVAGLSDQLKANITDLAYALARAAEPGGRLSEPDVQRQLDKITGGLQSKTRMAAALVEVHNQQISQMRNKYRTSRDAKVKGTEREWKDWLTLQATGELHIRNSPDGIRRGIGYWAWVKGADGKKKRIFRTIARWVIE